MDLSLLTTKLKKIDRKNNLRFYLFGSAKNEEKPNDLDLMIVYGNKYSLSEMIEIRKISHKIIYELYLLDSDIILFSEKEAGNNSAKNSNKNILLEQLRDIGD